MVRWLSKLSSQVFDRLQMGDLINLRQARKSRKRAEDSNKSEANRLKHGRTKADKRLAALTKQRQDSIVDGARLEPEED